MNSEIRIAILSKDFGWGGGVELLRTIVNGLLSIQDEHHLRIFLLLPVDNKVDTARDLVWSILNTTKRIIKQKNWDSIRAKPAFDSSLPDYFQNVDAKIETVEYNASVGLIPTLGRIGASVVIPANSSLGVNFPFPWVGYICDFQHKYFPDYFDTEESLDRDELFAKMLQDAKAIIVNSRSVKHDITTFYPSSNCKVFDLPFSGAPAKSWLETDDSTIRERYNLPERFFMISNQFWIHKSHDTAFKALKLLRNSGDYADIHFVCTGKMEDYRFPQYVQSLRQKVSALGLSDIIYFLGHIPKIDQISIMKKSLAVIQPTLFEGGPGGGAVWDAVALAVPAIVSNIPVNEEIADEGNVFYFNAGSPESLFETMKLFLEQDVNRPPISDLIEQGNARKQMLGKRLLETIQFVINK